MGQGPMGSEQVGMKWLPLNDEPAPDVTGYVPDEAWYNDPGPRTDFTFFVPPLQDTGHPTGHFYVWLRVTAGGDGDSGEDFELELCGEGDPMPNWLDREIQESGLEELAGASNWATDSAVHGWIFCSRRLKWALEKGIAPGQPFLVRTTPPVYSRDYWGETDCDWDREIVSVLPWSQDEVRDAWGKALETLQRHRDDARGLMEQLHARRTTDVAAMYLQRDRYNVGRPNDTLWPGGSIVRLCTDHTSIDGLWKSGSFALAEGRDDGGNSTAAMENLIGKALVQLPHLTGDQIRALPWRGPW